MFYMFLFFFYTQWIKYFEIVTVTTVLVPGHMTRGFHMSSARLFPQSWIMVYTGSPGFHPWYSTVATARL